MFQPTPLSTIIKGRSGVVCHLIQPAAPAVRVGGFDTFSQALGASFLGGLGFYISDLDADRAFGDGNGRVPVEPSLVDNNSIS